MTRFCVRVHHAGYTFADLRRLAQSAERLGFDGLSLYDVLNPRALEVWTALSALGSVTRRLVLMPLVLDVGYRHPALLAKMSAALDHITGGHRLILGLGYGGNPADHERYGFDWRPRVPERVAQLETHVRRLRELWTDEEAGFPTRTEGGLPILIASRGVKFGLGGVARHADLCNISFDLSPSEWVRFHAVLNEHGRDPSSIGLTHNATVVIAERRADAERAFQQLAQSRNLTAEQARHGLEHALVGTPGDIVDRLRAYADAGVDLAWVFLLFPDLPRTRSLELFSEAVLPSFQAPTSESGTGTSAPGDGQ